jgi:hypothetical protein
MLQPPSISLTEGAHCSCGTDGSTVHPYRACLPTCARPCVPRLMLQDWCTMLSVMGVGLETSKARSTWLSWSSMSRSGAVCRPCTGCYTSFGSGLRTSSIALARRTGPSSTAVQRSRRLHSSQDQCSSQKHVHGMACAARSLLDWQQVAAPSHKRRRHLYPLRSGR